MEIKIRVVFFYKLKIDVSYLKEEKVQEVSSENYFSIAIIRNKIEKVCGIVTVMFSNWKRQKKK